MLSIKKQYFNYNTTTTAITANSSITDTVIVALDYADNNTVYLLLTTNIIPVNKTKTPFSVLTPE